MLRLIIYQFNFRKREWLGTFPILFIAGVVTGVCSMLLFNILDNIEAFHQEIPTPLFVAPIFLED